jgi:hypothetical protein
MNNCQSTRSAGHALGMKIFNNFKEKLKSETIIEAIKSLVGTEERNKVYAILDVARKKEFYHIFDPDKHRDNAYIFEQIHRDKWFPELP